MIRHVSYIIYRIYYTAHMLYSISVYNLDATYPAPRVRSRRVSATAAGCLSVASGLPLEQDMWAPGMIFHLEALECSLCPLLIKVYSLHLGSVAHPDVL